MNKFSTSDSSSSSSISNKNKNAGNHSTNRNEDMQYLQKKISRMNFMENNFLDKKILNESALNTSSQKNIKNITIKNINNEGKKPGQMIMNSSNENEMFNNFLKNEVKRQKSGKSSSEEQTDIYKNLNMEQNEETHSMSDMAQSNLGNNKNNKINDFENNLNQINGVNKINNEELNSERDKNKNESQAISNEHKISPLKEINNTSNINHNDNYSYLNGDKIEEKENEKKEGEKNENFLDLNSNFSDTEIEIAKNIENEFNEYIKEYYSESDQLVKVTIFFINKGFNENIRFILYKCLINYGYPFVEKFNQFYHFFDNYCVNEKIKTPEKMYTEFYCEYILKMLRLVKSTNGKNKYISDFFFNGENMDTIISNLNLINDIKENIDNHYYIQNLLESKYDIIFKSINHKINKDFAKSKAVLCKILSNIITKCNKNGYLKYRQLIANESVLFDGVKIKSQHNTKFNLKKMISLKIFGQEFGDKKFNTVLQDYFLHLFSIYKPIYNNK